MLRETSSKRSGFWLYSLKEDKGKTYDDYLHKIWIREDWDGGDPPSVFTVNEDLNSWTILDGWGEVYFAAGIPSTLPYKYATHHLTPARDSRAETARSILERYGINVNSASNDVFLPVTESDYSGDAAIHRGNHGPEYINQLTKNLLEADKKLVAIKRKHIKSKMH